MSCTDFAPRTGLSADLWGGGWFVGLVSPEVKSLSQVLAAVVVPNDGGRLRWPVGQRSVGGPAGDGASRLARPAGPGGGSRLWPVVQFLVG
jgi:hypothetical protein